VADNPSVGVGLSQWALYDHPPAPTYYNSRLCLAGDAAHASTPHQGAGASQAIEDAFVLSNLLGYCVSKESISSAFAAYDAVRRPRTQMVVETSRKQGMLFDLEDENAWDGDELNMSRLAETIERRIRQIWDVSMLAELEKAMTIFKEGDKTRKTNI
jgi:salicylate hydroxylase